MVVVAGVVIVVVVVYLCICLSASLKTKLFCETSSIFEVDNIKKEAILGDFLNFCTWQRQKPSNSARLPSKMESWVQSWRPRAIVFCDCSIPFVQGTAPEKWGQVIRSAASVTQNHLSKPEDLMLQNATPLRKPAPGPPNMSDSCVSCTAPATRNASLQIHFTCSTPANQRFRNCYKNSTFCSLSGGAESLAPATQNHILTSKSAPRPSVFNTSD